jgi:hypothetical protein
VSFAAHVLKDVGLRPTAFLRSAHSAATPSPLVEKLRGSSVICFLTSLRPNVPGQIADDSVRVFFEHLAKLNRSTRSDRLIRRLARGKASAWKT